MSGFQKQRVKDQIVTGICERIRAGAWHDYLPSERWLSGDFGVGRDQVHQAIIKLREMGVISLEGRKNRITGLTNLRNDFMSVVVMSPKRLREASHSFLFCIDQLRNRLSGKDVPVYVETSVTMTRNTADKRLETMLEKHPHAVWILHRATPKVQRWFEEQGLPVIVLGTAAESVSLPYIDIDQNAAVQHALGTMLRAGHSMERVLFLRPSNELEGVRRMETAYREEMIKSGLASCVMYYREDYEGLESKLQVLFKSGAPIDGVITTSYRAAAYLGGWLSANRGLVVGRDLSLLCLADGPALTHLYPSVAYYAVQGDAFSRKLIRLVNQMIAGEKVTGPQRVQVIPDYIEGGSMCKRSENGDVT